MGPYPPSLSSAHDRSTSLPPTALSPCKRDRSPNCSPLSGSARPVPLDQQLEGGRRLGPWEVLQSRAGSLPSRNADSSVATPLAVAPVDGLPTSISTTSGLSYDGLPQQEIPGWTASPNFFTSRRPVGEPSPPPFRPIPSSTSAHTLAIQRTSSPSLGLSRLHLPEAAVVPARTFSSADAPAIRSPASSFLSAFSSPTASFASPPPSLSSVATSIVVFPDEAGQPAGASGSGEILGKLLGKGASGVVREVVDAASGERVQPPQAVKVVSLKPKRTSPDDNTSEEMAQLLEDLKKEIELWESLPAHPSLLPLARHHITQDAVYLFMPFMPQGSLFDVVRRHKEHDPGRGRPRLFSSSRMAPVQITATEEGASKAFPHDEARRYFTEVAKGVAALHAAGVVHGDLKCENVLLNAENHCRLSDFGFSVRTSVDTAVPTPGTGTPSWSSTTPTTSSSAFVEHQRSGLNSLEPMPAHSHRRHLSAQPRQASSPFPLRSPSAESPPLPPNDQIPPGSLPYTAPELFRTSLSAHPNKPTPATDVWALGILLYFLITSGSFPFADAFEPRLQLKIIRGVWDLPEGIEVGKECMDVLKGCLTSELGNRWTIDDVLASEWLQGWEEVRSSRSRSRSRARPSNSRGRGSRSRSRASNRRAEYDGVRSSTSMDRLSVAFGGHGQHVQASPTESTASFPTTPSHSLSPPPIFYRSKGLAEASAEAPTFSPSSSRSNSRSRSRSRGRSSRPKTPIDDLAGLSVLTSVAGDTNSSSQERSLSRGRQRGSYHDGQESLGRGRPCPPASLRSFHEDIQEEQHM